MLREQQAPGSAQLVDCKKLSTLKTWYEKHGAEYLQRLESSPKK